MKSTLSSVLAAAAFAALAPRAARADEPLTLHGYVQGWWLADREATAEPTVLFRHAALTVAARHGAWSAFTLLDAAPVWWVGPSRATAGEAPGRALDTLNDLVVNWQRGRLTLTAGQAGLPIGVDGPRSHDTQWFIERSQIGHVLGESADTGAWATVTAGPLTAQVGVLGGEGMNALPGAHPRMMARVTAGDGVIVGATALGGPGPGAWITGVDVQRQQGRFEAEAELYAGAPDADSPTVAGVEAAVHVHAGRWVPAARVEWFDGDVGATGTSLVRATACLSYEVSDGGASRVQLQVSAARPDDRMVASTTDGDHRVVVAGQLGF